MNSADVRNAVQCCLIVSFAAGTMVWGQNYGAVTLPARLADAGTTVQRAATSTPALNKWAEGPVVSGNGTVFFSEQLSGNIWKVSAAGVMTKLVTVSSGSTSYVNGMDFSPVTGNLVVCEQARITERDTADGHVIKIITSGSNWGQGANDLSFAANGDMFYTCFNQHIFLHTDDSTIDRDWNFTSPSNCSWNGIEYVEEKEIIYLCQYGQNKVLSFRVDPVTHLIDTSSKKTFASLPSPDGITVDSLYNVYVACNSGSGTYPYSIVVYDSTGTALGSIRLIQKPPSTSSSITNCVFGSGQNARTLYITGDSGTFKVELKVPGRVRPGESSVMRERSAFNDDGGAGLSGPGLSIVRSADGFMINSRLSTEAQVAVYSASGRRYGTFPVQPDRFVTWRPPVSGTYIVAMSGNGAVVRQLAVFGR